MTSNTIIVGASDLPFTPLHEIPSKYQMFLNPNAKAYYRSYEGLNVLTQVIHVREFSVLIHFMDAREKQLVYPFSSRPTYALYYQETDDVRGNLQDEGDVVLKAKRCILLSLAPGYQQAEIEAGITTCINVNVEPYLIPALCKTFPAFRFLEDIRRDRASGIVGLAPFEVNTVCGDILNRIEECGYIGEMADYYLHRACGNYYQNFIRQLMFAENPEQSLTVNETEILTAIQTFIPHHLNEPLTLRSLVTRFGLPELTIRKGFDQLFCVSVPAYINQVRMEEAFYLLVHTTDSVAEIACRLGYQNADALSRAFRAYYGCDPLLLRNAQ